MVHRLLASLFASAVVLSVLITLGGCETVKGAGRDMTNIGEAGERAISK
jgi:predicted small secreted protein